jgi:hypothetical protein
MELCVLHGPSVIRVVSAQMRPEDRVAIHEAMEQQVCGCADVRVHACICKRGCVGVCACARARALVLVFM